MSTHVSVHDGVQKAKTADELLIVRSILGNTADEPWADALARWEQKGRVERLRVDTWEAQKSRLRKRTDRGTELGITLPRGNILRHGDVLFADEATHTLIIVEVEDRQMLVLEMEPKTDPAEMAQLAVKVGHMLGNQHWPVKVAGLTVYVPIVVAEKVMESVLKTHDVPGVKWQIVKADPTMELPLVAPDVADHVHGHSHSHHHGMHHDEHEYDVVASARGGTDERDVSSNGSQGNA